MNRRALFQALAGVPVAVAAALACQPLVVGEINITLEADTALLQEALEKLVALVSDRPPLAEVVYGAISSPDVQLFDVIGSRSEGDTLTIMFGPSEGLRCLIGGIEAAHLT